MFEWRRGPTFQFPVNKPTKMLCEQLVISWHIFYGLHACFWCCFTQEFLGMWGPGRAAVNIRRAGGETGEAQRGFISYDFNVCLSDIPASRSPLFPSIFMHTLSATYLQNAQYHISVSYLFLMHTHIYTHIRTHRMPAYTRDHLHVHWHKHTQPSPLLPSWDVIALKNNTNGHSAVPQQYHWPGRILNRWVL